MHKRRPLKQRQPNRPIRTRGMKVSRRSGAAAPAEAGAGPANGADLHYDPAVMARAREKLRVENGEVITHAIILDRLEATSSDGAEGYAWDAQGWYGGDINRFWWKSEGEGAFDGDVEHAELQLLYSRAVTPYFDLQGGVRQTYRPEGDRTDLVLGVKGLAPYWFEVDGALFVSNEGELTARARAEYDLRLTQRLILQPRAEVTLSAQEIPESRSAPASQTSWPERGFATKSRGALLPMSASNGAAPSATPAISSRRTATMPMRHASCSACAPCSNTQETIHA